MNAWRRFAAAGLCACILTLPAVADADASQSGVDAKDALKYLEANGVYQGPDDPVRQYFGTDRFLTPLGEVMYRYLKARPDPVAEVEGMKGSFQVPARSGPCGANKARAFAAHLRRYRDRLGSLLEPPDAGAEDVFRLGALREAFMTGAAVGDSPKIEFAQLDLPNGRGWEFWDRQGLAFRLNENQVAVYNRELQKMQRELNRARPPQAPFIPETGRYNYQMFAASWWRLKLQLDQLELAARLDRMVAMAELLGEQKKDQNFFDRDDPDKVNEKFEADLAAQARAKVYSHKGRTYSAWDVAQAKTKVRAGYLGQAAYGIACFHSVMDRLKAAEAITDQKVKALGMGERYVMRYLSLACLEAQKYAVRNWIERFDPESPDARMVAEGLRAMTMDGKDKSRYRVEGEKLRSRLERLMAGFGRVEDALFKTDYASRLDLGQAALNRSQKELSEIGADYELYTTAPGMILALKSQAGAWLPSCSGSADPRQWSWGWLRRAVADARVHSGYSEGMREAARSLPAYEDIARMVGRGDYQGARQAVIALNPDAANLRPTMPLNGEPARINDAARLAAALHCARDKVAKVAEVNRWVDMAASFITWSVAAGLGAPVLRQTLAVVETYADKMGLRLIAAAAEQVRLRLATLEPAPERLNRGRMRGVLAEYLRRSCCRSVSFAGRQAAFTLLSGAVSGTCAALSHYAAGAPGRLNLGVMRIGGGDSNFKNGADAAGQGFAGGMQWANSSFHPALGYIGVPSNYFEGRWFSGVAQTLGERGALGSLTQGARYLAGRVAERSALAASAAGLPRLAAAAVSGRLACPAGGSFAGKALSHILLKPARFAWDLADNFAKYALFSQGAGWVAKKANWVMHYNEPDVGTETDLKTLRGLERRSRRAEQAGLAVSESPAWLLIPVFPAKHEAAARGWERSVQGSQEYVKAGRDAELANAEADRTCLPMLGKNQPPVMRRIFNFTIKGAAQTEAGFIVTKDIKRRAIARRLKAHVAGGKAGADPAAVSLAEYLSISRSDPQSRPRIGELFNTEDVRNEARKQCVEALVKNQGLAERILAARPGGKVEGFGRTTPAVQREVAAMMLYELPAGARLLPKVRGLAQGLVQRYLDSDGLGRPGGPADTFLRKAAANTHETPAQAEALRALLKEMRDTVAGWERDVELQAAKTGYPELLSRLGRKVEAEFKAGALTRDQFEALAGMFKLIAAQEARFQSCNNVETTHRLLSAELAALRVRYEGHAGLQRLLDGLRAKLSAWRDAVPEAARRTTVADAAPFKCLLRDFNKGIGEALLSRVLSPQEAAFLRETVMRDMAGAPWNLHDSKGAALRGWRPGQFAAYFTALTSVVEMGKGAEPIRNFLRLRTGGGKTLLAFEGLLPIAEADARRRGMKVGFFTLQSNLDAQAQLEWRALRKLGSQLEFDTYEGLKSKIAEAKNRGRKYVDNIWILGDEMDGAALQPALALGETAGRIRRENRLYGLYRKMRSDAFAVAHSPIWDRDEGEAARQAASRYARRIDGEGLLPLMLHAGARFAVHLWQNRFEYPKKLIGRKAEIRPFALPVDQAGLTRRYAAAMLKDTLCDPLLPAGQRDMLAAAALSSLLWPRGVAGRGSSWVREEFINMVRGYHDDYAAVRMDNLTGRINVIHDGQWFETMDKPTRRFWELAYGADLTLPYTRQAISTIKDVTANKGVRLFAFSATAGDKYLAHLGESGIVVGGQGSRKPGRASFDLRAGAGKFTAAGEALRRVQRRSRRLVAVRPAEVFAPEAEARPEVRAYLEAQGLAEKDALVLDLDTLPEGPVRDYFARLRGRQRGSTGLLVVSLPDTRALKMMRRYLLQGGFVREGEVAQIFSDAEYLRRNRPQARVHEQMNLDAMRAGSVKVLLLDTRVGGRGLDLDYKGDRGDPRLDAFKGYTNYEMLVIDPHRMSATHLLQAEGRIDASRVLPGAPRDFRLILDVKDLHKDAVLQDMFRRDGLFAGQGRDPGVPEQVLAGHLERRQQSVEEDQLRASAVLQDRPSTDPQLRWLDRLAR